MFKKFLSLIVITAMLFTMWVMPAGAVTGADIELLEGTYYTLNVDEVKPFKKGDTVEITFTVDDVPSDLFLLTIDMNFEYDNTVLTPLIDDFTSTCEEVNANTPGDDAWEMLHRADDLDDATHGADKDGIYIGLMEDSDNWLGSNESGVLAFTMVFTAERDAKAGEVLVWATCLEAMTVEFEDGTGSGAIAKVAGEAETPTDKPEENPTDDPDGDVSNEPTDKPDDDGETPTEKPLDNPTEVPSEDKPESENTGNPGTFEIGAMSLMALGGAALVLVKKRRK